MSQINIRAGSTIASACNVGLVKAYHIPETEAFCEAEINSSEYENEAFYHCVLTECNLQNCYLFHCLVVESSVDGSTLEHCTVVDQILDDGLSSLGSSFVVSRYSKLRGCFVVYSTVKGSRVSGSKVSRGQLSECQVQTSVLSTDIRVYYSYLNTCKVTKGRLHHSTIHDTEVLEASQSNCQVISTPFSLRRVPAEIRILTFTKAFTTDMPTVKTPALLQALRGDPKLYGEALEAFYKTSTFRISPFNADSRKLMSQNAISNIQSLHIQLPFSTLDIPTSFPPGVRIRKLTIDFTEIPCHESYDSHQALITFMHFGVNWIPQLQTIEEFSAIFTRPTEDGYRNKVPHGASTFNQGMGIKPVRNDEMRTTNFTWKADEGNALTWTWNKKNTWVDWLRIWEDYELDDDDYPPLSSSRS